MQSAAAATQDEFDTFLREAQPEPIILFGMEYDPVILLKRNDPETYWGLHQVWLEEQGKSMVALRLA